MISKLIQRELVGTHLMKVEVKDKFLKKIFKKSNRKVKRYETKGATKIVTITRKISIAEFESDKGEVSQAERQANPIRDDSSEI